MAIDVADVLERADAVLAELRALDLDGVGDDALTGAVLSLQRLRGSLEVAEARALSRWGRAGRVAAVGREVASGVVGAGPFG